ncbi:MAG: hypothetical protein AAFY71_26760 [Bacteroidota bacterium]
MHNHLLLHRYGSLLALSFFLASCQLFNTDPTSIEYTDVDELPGLIEGQMYMLIDDQMYSFSENGEEFEPVEWAANYPGMTHLALSHSKNKLAIVQDSNLVSIVSTRNGDLQEQRSLSANVNLIKWPKNDNYLTILSLDNSFSYLGGAPPSTFSIPQFLLDDFRILGFDMKSTNHLCYSYSYKDERGTRYAIWFRDRDEEESFLIGNLIMNDINLYTRRGTGIGIGTGVFPPRTNVCYDIDFEQKELRFIDSQTQFARGNNPNGFILFVDYDNLPQLHSIKVSFPSEPGAITLWENDKELDEKDIIAEWKP